MLSPRHSENRSRSQECHLLSRNFHFFSVASTCLMLFSWVQRLLRDMKTASVLANINPKTSSAPKPSQFLQDRCPTPGDVPSEGMDDGPEALPRYLPCVYGQAPTSVSQ